MVAGSEPRALARADDRAYLRACIAAYEELVAMLATRAKTDEDRLRWIQLVADFAWWHHPGRFVDGRLENLALEIGRRLPPWTAPIPAVRRAPLARSRHVLHVLTQAPHVGGHVRLLRSWIEKDAASAHSLFVLDPPRGQPSIPDWLARAVEASGGAHLALPPERSLLRRAALVRAMVGAAAADLVVLHHHPSDAVPVAALAIDGLPPVGLLNHADHVFGLGSSVADSIINIRPFARRISESRRAPRHTALVPLPVSLPEVVGRDEARARLGIPAGETMLLCIGSAYKFARTERHDFFATAKRLLDRSPDAHLYMIGVDPPPDGPAAASWHPRIHALGVLEDATLHQVAADIYLEGFPYGGLLALLESCGLGLPPALMFDATSQQAVADDPGLAGLVANPPDEQSYLDGVAALIGDPVARRRLGEGVREQVRRAHVGPEWNARLEEAYAWLLATQHQPRALSGTDACETEDDLNLAEFQRRLDRGIPLLALPAKRVPSIGDVLALWAASRRTGDSTAQWRHTRTWLSRVWRRVRARAS